jgi:integrase
MTAVRFLGKDAPRRERGSGTITLRAERDKRGNPIPARFDVASGTPLFKWLYRSPNGGTKILLAATRQTAEDLAHDWERERPASGVGRGTFAELADAFLRWKGNQGSASQATTAYYRERLECHVLPVLGLKQATAITPADISDMLERAALGPRTGNSLVTLVSMVFTYGLDMGRVTGSPIRPKLHRRSVKETVRLRRAALQEAMPTQQQVRDFIDHAMTRDDGTSAGVALALALETGLRREELLHLRREDVTLTDKLADIRVATDFLCGCKGCAKDGGRQRTKNRHARYVPLSKRAATIVKQQLARLERDAIGGQWLFPVLRHAPYMRFGAGSQMHREHLAAAMRGLSSAAGIALPDGCAIHFCRHVALSRWEVAGLSQGQRDLASGHDAAGVRATYSHGDRAALFAAFRKHL